MILCYMQYYIMSSVSCTVHVQAVLSCTVHTYIDLLMRGDTIHLFICLFVCCLLQEPHLWLVPTLEKAVVQFLATSDVLAESQTLQSVTWAGLGRSTVTMIEMLQ